MGDKTNYLRNKILDHELGTAAFTKPTAVYVALFTVIPTKTTTGTEVTGGSYARQAMAFKAAVNGATENSAEVTFPTATANWGNIVAVGLLDAATAGNLLMFKGITTEVINTGNIFKFLANDFDVTED